MLADKQAEKKRLTKLAWIIVIYQVLGSYALIIIQNYGNFVMTNVVGLSPAMAATCMSVSGMFLVAWSLFNGAFVQNTRSKWGQFRPWYIFGIYVCVFSGYLMYIKFGNAVIITAIVVSLGYIIPQATMDLLYTARIGMFTKMAAGNTEGNVLFNSYNWLGTYFGYFVAGATTVPLVEFFGKGNEAMGFIGAHTVYGIACIIAYNFLAWVAKPYDLPNKGASIEKTEKVNIVDMVKGVLGSKPGLCVILSDIGRFTAYYALMNLIAYQCTYVIGDLNASATVFAVTNIGGLIGSYLAPVVAKKIGRKNTMRTFDILNCVSLAAIAFFGKTTMGLTVVVTLFTFFNAFGDGCDPAMYMDAGQYTLAKTGKDTRSYFNSMYNVAVKASVALAGLVSNGLLAMIAFDPDMVFDEALKSKFSMMIAVAMVVCYVLPLVMMAVHPMSDKEADEYTRQNTEAENARLAGK